MATPISPVALTFSEFLLVAEAVKHCLVVALSLLQSWKIGACPAQCFCVLPTILFNHLDGEKHEAEVWEVEPLVAGDHMVGQPLPPQQAEDASPTLVTQQLTGWGGGGGGYNETKPYS